MRDKKLIYRQNLVLVTLVISVSLCSNQLRGDHAADMLASE